MTPRDHSTDVIVMFWSKCVPRQHYLISTCPCLMSVQWEIIGGAGEGGKLRGSGLLHSHMIVLIKSSNILVTVSFASMLPFPLISVHYNSDYTTRARATHLCFGTLYCSSGRKDRRGYRTDEFSNEPKLTLVIIPSMHGNNEINTDFAFLVLFLTKSIYPLVTKLLEDWQEGTVIELFRTTWGKVDCQS